MDCIKFLFLMCIYLGRLWCVWGLSSPIRVEPTPPASEGQSPNTSLQGESPACLVLKIGI